MEVARRGSPDYDRRSNSPFRDVESRRWATSPFRDMERKRKRSTSPIDRHVRGRFDEYGYHDQSRYGQTDRRVPKGPQDPMTRDSLASFRQYSEWFKFAHPERWQEEISEKTEETGDESLDKKEPSVVRAHYEEYRKSFIRKQYKYMFDYHRKYSWFVEKYDMRERYVDMRERVRQEGTKGCIDQFTMELEAGNFDPPLPGNETSALASKPTEEEDEDINMEENGQTSSKGPAEKKAGPGEHLVAPNGPQLMIRTLPPDIGRLKLEEFLKPLSGFKYVAIGDPVQKRQFYRAAWVAFEFEDDVKKAITELESKKIENFRLPVSHISEPLIAKIRYAPSHASKLIRMEKDLEQVKALAAVLETQAAEVAAYKPIFPVGAPMDVEPPSGDVPNGQDEENDTAKEEIDTSRGSKAVEERIDRIASETLDTDENGNPDQAKRVALSLDLYLAYLREAFHCCYYCAVVADHAEELARKCIKHERRPEAQTDENGNADGKPTDGFVEMRWTETLDHKIACLLDKANVDPTEYGGTRFDDELETMAAPYVNHEDEGKWRCSQCKKLFRAQVFVEKHIYNKHPELVKPAVEEWELFNNFILDPQHILPMQSVPVNQFGVAQHPPQAFGLPPDWRAPNADGARHDRNGRDGRDGARDRDRDFGRDRDRDRDRRAGYSSRPNRRSPSPSAISYNRPLRFSMTTDNGQTFGVFSNGSGNGNGSDYNPGSASARADTAAPLPVVPGLPAKPVHALPVAAPASKTPLLERMSAPQHQHHQRSEQHQPPPPPPGARTDPRSRMSYHDLDMVDGAEDIALQY